MVELYGRFIGDNKLQIVALLSHRGSIRLVKGSPQGVKSEPVGGKC